MKQLLKPLLVFLSSVLLLHQKGSAQEDNKKISLVDTSGTQGINTSKTTLIRLKKAYQLGDGLTFSSSVGSLSISQSLQTLYGVSSPNKDLSDLSSQFSISRARMTLIGNLFDNKFALDIRLNFPSANQSATTGNRSFNNVLQEAYVEYNPNVSHSFNFGLRADYVDTREIRVEGENLGFINRSAVSEAFNAIFDFGLRYKGNYRISRRSYLKPYVSITTGDSRASLQKNFGGFKYGLRLDYLPFGRFSSGGEFYNEDLAREEKPRLVAGAVYSYNDGQSSAIGTNGGRYIYGDKDQKTVLPGFTKWGGDFLFKYRGFNAMGSYVQTSAHVPSSIAGEFSLAGKFTAYTGQTEEQIASRVRSRLNLGSGYHIQAGYIFNNDWSFNLRYAKLEQDRDAAVFADQDKHYTILIAKYLSGNNLKVQTEIGFDELRKELRTGDQKGNYYGQLQFTLQL